MLQFRPYFELLKPRVMVLVLFTGFCGLYLAPVSVSWEQGFAVCFFLLLGSGGAGAVNMWYDRDIDAVMLRTRARPIPSGLVSESHALAFSLIVSGVGVLGMWWVSNIYAAGALLAAILLYGCFYTMYLKRHTSQNIVIGGLPGAMPPLIAWLAVDPSWHLYPWILVAIIFFWTPPHFWSLCLYSAGDYAKVGVPMLPNTAGKSTTLLHMSVHMFLLVIVSFFPWFLEKIHHPYLIVWGVLNGGFICGQVMLFKKIEDTRARKLFAYSIFYLFALFAALLIFRR